MQAYSLSYILSAFAQTLKHYFKWASITLVLSFVSIWAILFFLPKPSLLAGLSSSKALFDEHQKLLRLTLSEDAKFRLYTPLKNISPLLIEATLLEEDQYFYRHPGINPISLIKAGWQTYVRHGRRLGASTLSMQVARMRFAIQSKTWSGKIVQMLRALQLEVHYSKQELLEAYLNLAPYGNNIEGVGAASLIYFDKPVHELNLPEALALAVIPQHPAKRIPQRNDLKQARYELYKRWIRKHADDRREKPLIDLPLQMGSVRTIPFLAPHFVNHVLTQSRFDQTQTITTTLDLRLQKMIERITRHYAARKADLGVKNAVVLLVDSRDMSVKAQLGSLYFSDEEIGGQINGAKVLRSPGSTLKPFIYALAIDQGLIHPDTLLKDVPHQFGNYNPENFDKDFIGPIKAKEALILSRNIPAIYLAEQLKNPALYEFLQAANIHHLKPAAYYGLSLVLGGAEMSMEELAGLYAMFINDGIWRPIRFTKKAPLAEGKQLLSPEASFLVLNMLKETTPPASTFKWFKDKKTQIAWKTGTSSGYRDAWTLGIAGPYVLGVWIGNFNNESNHAFIGKEIAAPLFFEIINAMQMQMGTLPIREKNPERMHLSKVEVCKVSGMLPSAYCQDRELTWFIPGKSPIKVDNIHRTVAIDSKTGLRTCHFNKHTRFETFEFWSSDLLKIFKRAGMERRVPPPYDTQCKLEDKTNIGIAPQIISPQAELKYVTRLQKNKQTLIPFTAIVDADVRNLYWFINETFAGKTARNAALIWHGRPGQFVVRVVDDYGRSDVCHMQVELER